MTQPRHEFWRPITPIAGEPIPEGAQYESGEPGEGQWFFFGAAYQQHFAACHLRMKWRSRVEVIPLDVAVEAVLQNAVVNPNIGKGLWQVFISGGEVIESSRFESLRLHVIDHLRKAAQ